MPVSVRSLVLALATAAVAAQPAWAEGLRKNEGSAEKAGFKDVGLARLDSTIEAAIRAHATPGAALAVGRHGQIVRLRGYGYLSWDGGEPVTDSTLYDIASLTKVVGTTSAIMILVERGLLDLDKPIYHYLPAWPWHGDHGKITLRHLLTHTSGLPAGADLWTTPGRVEKIQRIGRMKLSNKPGMVTVYSDLGMIVAAAVVESVAREPLDEFLYREIFEPLGMRETRFNPRALVVEEAMMTRFTPILAVPTGSAFFAPFQVLARWAPPAPSTPAVRIPSARIAPTEAGVPRGYVHDRNAASMNGVAGHAGLFSSVRDLAVFADMMLKAAHGQDLPFASAQTVNMFFQKSNRRRGRALGWDIAQGERSSAGDYFTQSSIGHTGFTGTSIWIDPERDLFVVLLTNRVHPSATNKKHIAMRRAVHDAVQLAIQDELVVARAD